MDVKERIAQLKSETIREMAGGAPNEMTIARDRVVWRHIAALEEKADRHEDEIAEILHELRLVSQQLAKANAHTQP